MPVAIAVFTSKLQPNSYTPEAPFGNQPEAPHLPEPFWKTTRVPECRTREHFSGCRASAPRVPELKPRPYPVDFPTTLRVLSERDTCPRVPPADKTLRKPPELATRSECLNSNLPPGALRVATCPETHPGRIPNTSRKPRMRCVPECRVSFPRMPPVAPRVPSRETTRMSPGSPANHPRKTLPGTRRVRHVSRQVPEK